jgi:hypothetical protein
MARQVDYEPMTLGNMRAHGMTRLDVSCHGPDCWHRAMVDVSSYPDDAIVANVTTGIVGGRNAGAAGSDADRAPRAGHCASVCKLLGVRNWNAQAARLFRTRTPADGPPGLRQGQEPFRHL